MLKISRSIQGRVSQQQIVGGEITPLNDAVIRVVDADDKPIGDKKATSIADGSFSLVMPDDLPKITRIQASKDGYHSQLIPYHEANDYNFVLEKTQSESTRIMSEDKIVFISLAVVVSVLAFIVYDMNKK